MTTAPAAARANPLPVSWATRVAWIGLGLYTLYAASLLEITWERFVYGLGNGARFIGRMLPPDFTPSHKIGRAHV